MPEASNKGSQPYNHAVGMVKWLEYNHVNNMPAFR